jgi:hypothetical protein
MLCKCRNCGSAPTIKAHIFPQAALSRIRTRGPDRKIVAVLDDRAIIAQNQNGIYDPQILCRDCDAKIGILDKWFVEHIDAFHQATVMADPFTMISVPVDPISAIKFAVSVIYRASISKRDDFSDISLGPYDNLAGDIAFGIREVGDEPLQVLINVLTSQSLNTKQFAFYPVRCSGSTGRYFVFTISGIQMLVKFGGARLGSTDDVDYFEQLWLRQREPLFALAYPFEESAEAMHLKSSSFKQRHKTR